MSLVNPESLAVAAQVQSAATAYLARMRASNEALITEMNQTSIQNLVILKELTRHYLDANDKAWMEAIAIETDRIEQSMQFWKQALSKFKGDQ